MGFGTYEAYFFLAIMYFLSILILSDTVRLRWWDYISTHGQNMTLIPQTEKESNGPMEWGFGISFGIIVIVSIYIIYKTRLWKTFFFAMQTIIKHVEASVFIGIIIFLCTIVLSNTIRLRWWEDNSLEDPSMKNIDNEEKHNNGSMEWAFYMTIIYISLASIYIIARFL